MITRGLLLCKAPSPKHLFFSPKFPFHRNIFNGVRSCSSTNTVSSRQPPACVFWLKLPGSLSLRERFGQLQAVDLTNVEPALRAATEVNSFRDDIPDAMINAVRSYEEPYIKVPKVLNKE